VGGSGGDGGTGGDGGSGGDVVAPAAVDIEWQTAEVRYPWALDHHVTFTWPRGEGGHWLYVVAGVTDRMEFHDAIRVAQIEEDGTVGAFAVSTIDYPLAVGGHAFTVAGGTVVIAGGRDETLTNRTEVFTNTPGADGLITMWRHAPSLPEGRFHATAAYHDGFVYVIGGLSGNVASDTIFRATIESDGTMGNWVEAGTLPEPRSHHASFVHDGWLYVLGGQSGNPMGEYAWHEDVWRAEIAADGSLGPWETLEPLPDANVAGAVVLAEGAFFVVGGIDSVGYTNAVHRADLAADGTIAKWTEVSPLPIKRAHVHQLPVVDGRAYSVGGSANAGSLDDVLVGTLVPAAD